MNQPPNYPPPGYPPHGYQPPPQPSRGTNPIVIVLAVLGVLFVLGAGSCLLCVGMGARGVAKSEARRQEKETKAKDVAKSKRKSAKEVDIDKLISTYKENEIKADELYKGQWIQVTGIADTIRKSALSDRPYMVLKSEKNPGYRKVHCDLIEDSGAGDVSKGESVTVAGRVDGLWGDVQMKECEVIK